MLHMDLQQRPRVHSIPEIVQGHKEDLTASVDSISNHKNGTTLPTNLNNKTGTLKIPAAPVTNTSGKSWMKIFGGQQTKQTPSKNVSTSSEVINQPTEPDLSYITSRLIVMTTPVENSADVSSRSTAELVREFLDTKHPDSYMLCSLDQSSMDNPYYRRELFHDRVFYLPLFDEKKPTGLIVLLWFCQKVTSYLVESPSNIVLLHCNDGKNQLAFAACSLLAYHAILPQVDQIIQYYELHRCASVVLTMTQKRYIQYLCDLSSGMIEKPHFNGLILQSINLSPIPLVNKQKTSCRPFVDIYDEEHKKVFSTYQEIAKLRVYSASDPTCNIPVDLPFKGDLTIHITHAAICQSRRTHEGGVRICELTINSNFSTINHPELSYLRNELDEIDHNEKCPIVFRVTLDIINQEKLSMNGQEAFSKQLDKTLKQPLALFQDENEFKQKINDYEKQSKHQNDDVNGKNEVPVSPPPVVLRSIKVKDDPISPSATNSTSLRNSGRLSGSFSSTPQSPTSFINPLHNPFKQPMETSPRSSQIPSSPLIEEKQIEEKPLVEPLLDIVREDMLNNDTSFQGSMSSDKQQEEFNSSTDSQINPLDDEINLQTSLLSPIIAIKIIETKQESPISPEKSNPTTNTVDYSVNITTNDPPSTKTQSKPVKPKPPTKTSKKSKEDSKKYFDGLCELNNDPKPQPTSPTSSAIGDMRKAVLSKDIDPTVLKVREWTEGKKRNLRSLLCSLSTVTWPECKWPGCQMNELLTHEQVKKAYRKALLYIHPDKLRGDPNEPLAKLIFVELNEAWSQFEQASN